MLALGGGEHATSAAPHSTSGTGPAPPAPFGLQLEPTAAGARATGADTAGASKADTGSAVANPAHHGGTWPAPSSTGLGDIWLALSLWATWVGPACTSWGAPVWAALPPGALPSRSSLAARSPSWHCSDSRPSCSATSSPPGIAPGTARSSVLCEAGGPRPPDGSKSGLGGARAAAAAAAAPVQWPPGSLPGPEHPMPAPAKASAGPGLSSEPLHRGRWHGPREGCRRCLQRNEPAEAARLGSKAPLADPSPPLGAAAPLPCHANHAHAIAWRSGSLERLSRWRLRFSLLSAASTARRCRESPWSSAKSGPTLPARCCRH
mmetsp:Transcript_109573/g.353661  ORF Transcript_109573/g.353661 Transcript_109573/m.353661 type:complete len:320 (+) Transcript_109573:761-1720(+)